MVELSNPSSKISQYLTEDIFTVTHTNGVKPNLLIPPHTVAAGENFGIFFLAIAELCPPSPGTSVELESTLVSKYHIIKIIVPMCQSFYAYVRLS